MAIVLDSKPAVAIREGEVTDLKIPQASISSTCPSTPTLDKTLHPICDLNPAHSIFHIYHKQKLHFLITPNSDPTKDRYSGPTHAEQKAKREAKNSRKLSNLPPALSDENAFFLHTPYLSFHCPPQVLYTGDTRHSTPTVLIHLPCLWREYKIQLGPTIAKVLDPRGVVGHRHNTDAQTRKSDGTALKGYRVRGWRLWGETGKEYVYAVTKNRRAGTGMDPDVSRVEDEMEVCARADEVVYLRWTNPLSKHTRRYSFSYRGVDFVWKGTGSVKESRRCGMLLRYSHLKLVASVSLPSSCPATVLMKKTKKKKTKHEDEKLELCLGTYTSSIASKKSGALVLFDEAILRLAMKYMPEMLEEKNGGDVAEQEDPAWKETRELSTIMRAKVDDENEAVDEDQMLSITRLKKSTLYQLMIATAMCMIKGEKEKRHTLLNLILGAGENAGGAGG